MKINCKKRGKRLENELCWRKCWYVLEVKDLETESSFGSRLKCPQYFGKAVCKVSQETHYLTNFVSGIVGTDLFKMVKPNRKQGSKIS